MIANIPEKYENAEIFSRGRHGLVLKAKYNNETIILKVAHPDSTANNTTYLEGKNLSIVNKFDIGPKLIEYNDDYVAMEFIDGVVIGDFIENSDSDDIKKLILDVFRQMFILDKNNFNKYEMTNPHKHVIVRNCKCVLIDFERSRLNPKTKNVTQFAQYVTGKGILPILQEKGILLDRDKFTLSVREYAKIRSEEAFENMMILV